MRDSLTAEGIKAAVRTGLPCIGKERINEILGRMILAEAASALDIVVRNPENDPNGADLALVGLARCDWFGEEDDGEIRATDTAYRAILLDDAGGVYGLWFSAGQVMDALRNAGISEESISTWGPLTEDRVSMILAGPQMIELPDNPLEKLRLLLGGGGTDH